MSQSALPTHLAMIMDGNGRWAERRGWPRVAGHRAGAETVRRVVEFCAERGIPELTLYAFSSDNWSRPRAEVGALFRLFVHYLKSERVRLVAQGIRLSVIGRRDRLPANLLETIEATESLTGGGARLHLRVALDYSSRHAIQASLPLTGAAPEGKFHGDLLPPVDLLVRTGGERRLSDFLLWESAYAELAFIDQLWPDLTEKDLDMLLADFATRDRRFGGLTVRVSA
jgi:undecaprenyl diphosphate synthase